MIIIILILHACTQYFIYGSYNSPWYASAQCINFRAIGYIFLGERLKYTIELWEKTHLCHQLKVWLIYVIVIWEKTHPCHYFSTLVLQNNFLPQQDPKQLLTLFNWGFGRNVLFLLVLPQEHQDHRENIKNSQISNFFNSSQNHLKFQE